MMVTHWKMVGKVSLSESKLRGNLIISILTVLQSGLNL